MTAMTRMTLSLALAGLAAATPAGAQNDWELTLGVRGGGYTSLTSLTGPGAGDFKTTGRAVGGTVGFQLIPAIAFRLDGTWSQNELRRAEVASGTKLNRMHVDASVQVQRPGPMMPYLFAGLGAVVMTPEGTEGKDRTMPAATLGLGVRYAIPGTHLALQAEGKGWLFEFPEFGAPVGGFSGKQFDVGLTAGLSYRIPLRGD